MPVVDFIKLESMPQIEEIEDVQVDTRALEREMINYNGGLWLRGLSHESIDEISSRTAKKYVPFYTNFRDISIRIMRAKYSEINKPCSMLVDSPTDLAKHMQIGYQISHFNYILGKANNRNFPSQCCGASSLNVMFSLMEFGYANAVYALNNEHDHAYVLLPFVETASGKCGSILIDPTSDQLYKHNENRNSIMIKTGTKWEYRTDWENGEDLFPDTIYSIDSMKKHPEMVFEKQYPGYGEEFLELAFHNPLHVTISMKSYSSLERELALQQKN